MQLGVPEVLLLLFVFVVPVLLTWLVLFFGYAVVRAVVLVLAREVRTQGPPRG